MRTTIKATRAGATPPNRVYAIHILLDFVYSEYTTARVKERVHVEKPTL